MSDIEIVIRAIDRFSEPARKASRAGDVMVQKLEAIGQTQGDIEHYKQLKLGVLAGNKSLAEMQAESQRLAKVLNDVRKASGETSSEFKKAEREAQAAARKTREFKGELQAQSAALQKQRDALKNAGISTKSLAGEQSRLKDEMAAATAAMNRQDEAIKRVAAAEDHYHKVLQTGANLSLISESAGRVGQGIKSALADPLQQSIGWESSLAEVAKTTGMAGDSLARYGVELDNMGTKIPIARAGLADISANAGQLGIAGDNLQPFVTTIAKMSTAFDMLPEKTATSMGKLANVYDIPTQNIEHLGDVINTLSNNSPAKAGEIVDGLSRIGGTAKGFGLASEEASALVSTMISLGKPPEVAGTAINSMLQKLQTAPQQGKKFQGALAEIGMTADGLQQSIGENANGALQDLLNRLAQLDSAQRAGVLVNLFGTEFSDDVGTLVGSLGKYRAQLALATNDAATAGSMEKEYQVKANTSASKIIMMQNRWDAMQTRIGDKLIPVLERAAPALETVIDGISWFVTELPGTSTVILGLTAVIGGVALVVSPVLSAIAALIGSISMLGLASTKASAAVAARGGAGALSSAAGMVKNAGLVGLSGVAGYGVGSLVNMGIDKVTQLATGGKNKSLGGYIYDATHAKPVNVAGARSITDSSTTTINVQQRVGENSGTMAKRVAELMERSKKLRHQAALHDAAAF